MGGFTAAYLGSAFVLLRILDLGAQGLVIANMVNTALRIWWSVVFIRQYFRQNGVAAQLEEMLPAPFMAASYLGPASALWWAYDVDSFVHDSGWVNGLAPLVISMAGSGFMT